MNSVSVGSDGKRRCAWALSAPEFISYHDTEWGFPVDDDHRLFEKLCLEGFQSGLSWRTILNKRENFREAFEGFDFERVARFTPKRIERLLTNAGIVRHRGKIESVVNNARRARELCEQEGSLGAFVWRFEPDRQSDRPAVPVSSSPESIALSRALKKRGWSFVGPTTAYAFMQSMGLVNDHGQQCVIHARCERARRAFTRPT
jgi:DNA-3-methyladenine glycosylase I